ncbi:MAG TPA: MFS transporter [Bacillales bacterium]|nr:MFS transporter [Bacillales bacterium]
MDLHRNVKIRLLIVVLQMSSSSMIIPFMAIYFAKYYGSLIAGLILIVTVLGSIVSSLFGGYCSDKFGRKNILVFGTALRFLSLLLMASANIPGSEIPILSAIALLAINISVGLQFPPLEAMVIDVTAPEIRKKVYTLLYWLNNCALVIGVFLGAFLHKKYFFLLILCTAAVNLLIFIMVRFLIVETATLSEKKTRLKSPLKSIASSYSLVFKDRTFLKFILAVLMTMGLEKQLSKYVSVHLGTHFHTTSVWGWPINGVEMFGILRIENAVAVVLLALGIGYVLSKLKWANTKQLYIGLALFTCGYVVLAFSIHLWVLVAFMFILTVGEMMFIPVKNVLLADIATEESRSQYMAANGLSMRAGSLLSAVWLSLSPLLHTVGMAILYGLMGAAAIWLYAAIFRERRQMQEAENNSISVNQ